MVPAEVPVLVVEDVRAVLGRVAAAIYGHPSHDLTVLGVTGTSGKTTTTYFVRAGLEAAGFRSGLIGTVATIIGDEPVKTEFHHSRGDRCAGFAGGDARTRRRCGRQ